MRSLAVQIGKPCYGEAVERITAAFGPSALPGSPRRLHGAAGGGLAAALLLCLSAPGARAQILENYLPAQVLGPNQFVAAPPEEYQPLGVRVGSFILHPQAEESVGYNSNVLGQDGAKGSPEIQTSATMQATSDWSRDSLSLFANVDNVQTPQVSSLSYTDYTASVAGSLDIDRDKLTGSYTYLHLNVLPNQIGGIGLQTVLPVETNDVRLGYTAQFARLQIIPAIDITASRYSNTVVDGQEQGYGYLSRNLYAPSVTARYELSTDRNLVFVLRGASAQYLTAQAGQPIRNYVDLEALAGIDYAASGVIRYRALLGFETRNYASSQIASVSSPIVEAQAIWTPTQLTTVTGIVTHRIEDAIEDDVYNYTYTNFRLAVDQEVQHNVVLEAYVNIQRANYGQDGGIQTQYGGGASAAWLLSRNVRLRASYDYIDSQAPSPSNYTGNVFLLRLQFSL